jgi:hypothetical protein
MKTKIKRLVSSLLVVGIGASGCDAGDRALFGECPDGNTCSDLTPRGLHFVSGAPSGSLYSSRPGPIAIGGQQSASLEVSDEDGKLAPLNLPYLIAGGPSVASGGQQGNVVVLKGLATGYNDIVVSNPADGKLFDKISVAAAAIDTIKLAGVGETVNDNEVAYAPQSKMAFQLLDKTGALLTDESAQASGPSIQRATIWDSFQLVDTSPGQKTISIKAGDFPRTDIAFQVVAGPDRVVAIDPPTSARAKQPLGLCFKAVLGATRVVGLPWTFTVDGTAEQSFIANNCILTIPKASGTIKVVASTAGLSVGLDIVVQPALKQKHDGELPSFNHAQTTETQNAWAATAGDRAAAAL